MALGGKRAGAGRKPDLKKQAIAEAYTKALAEAVAKEKKPIIEALISKAKTGDIQAIREIHERILGKVKDVMDLNGNLNHTFNDIPESAYKAIIQREANRVKVSGD